MMKFEKLMVTFTDMMEADSYSILNIRKPDTHTYVIKLHDDDDRSFEYVRGAARFIEEYYTRISVEYQYGSAVGDNDVMTIVFKEDVGQE